MTNLEIYLIQSREIFNISETYFAFWNVAVGDPLYVQ